MSKDKTPTRAELEALEARIDRLENRLDERIDATNRRIDHLNEQMFQSGRAARWDRYDEFVLSVLEPGEEYNPRQVMSRYEHAGIKDPSKRENRAKILRRSELFDGNQFVGRDQ